MIKLGLIFLYLSVCLHANEAIVENVQVIKKEGKYSFKVRILHQDSGWKHYVNRYEVLDAKGNILATRILVHPHEFEQPFTRSLNNIQLHNLQKVYIRAHDNVDGYSRYYEIILP